MNEILRSSSRICIRRFLPSDADALHKVLSDADVMRYLEPPFTRAQTVRFLEEAGLSEPPLVYAAVLPQDGACIGHVIYHPFGDAQTYELGWVLRRDCWGRGIASAITELLIADARERGFKGLVLECLPEQTATRRIAQKYGFVYAGTAQGCMQFSRSL